MGKEQGGQSCRETIFVAETKEVIGCNGEEITLGYHYEPLMPVGVRMNYYPFRFPIWQRQSVGRRCYRIADELVKVAHLLVEYLLRINIAFYEQLGARRIETSV
jgi:hypothetical protein